MKNIFNTYSRHLIKKSFLISAMVWTVMLFLDFSVTLVLELENISAEKDFFTILSVLLYEQPSKGMQYLESSMLIGTLITLSIFCLLYTSPSPRDATLSRMPSSA